MIEDAAGIDDVFEDGDEVREEGPDLWAVCIRPQILRRPQKRRRVRHHWTRAVGGEPGTVTKRR